MKGEMKGRGCVWGVEEQCENKTDTSSSHPPLSNSLSHHHQTGYCQSPQERSIPFKKGEERRGGKREEERSGDATDEEAMRNQNRHSSCETLSSWCDTAVVSTFPDHLKAEEGSRKWVWGGEGGERSRKRNRV